MNHDKGQCEHCSGTNIVNNCIQCGAPICCVDCCNETTKYVSDGPAAKNYTVVYRWSPALSSYKYDGVKTVSAFGRNEAISKAIMSASTDKPIGNIEAWLVIEGGRVFQLKKIQGAEFVEVSNER